MAGSLCEVGGALTSEERRRLPSTAFGLPSRRAYPMPDVSHARNAKARAAQQRDAGTLTARDYNKIEKKADRIIEACARPGNPNGKGKKMSTIARMANSADNPGPPLWPWILGGVLGVGVVAGVGWLVLRKEAPPKFTGVAKTPEPPSGFEVTTCEQYKTRTLCVVKPLEGLPKWFAWTVDGGEPNGEFALPPFAMAAAKAFVDSLSDEPLPGTGDDGPEAGQEGAAVQPDIAQGIHGHGVTIQYGDAGQCETFTVNDLGAWLNWATNMLGTLNMAAWTSEEIMNNVWGQTFPVCGEKLSDVAGVTIAGQPYASIVQSGQAFLDAGTASLPEGQTLERAFAGKMVGQAVVPPPAPIDDPTEIPQFPMTGDADQIVKLISTTGVKWTVALLPQSVYEPAAQGHVFSVPWYAWSEGTDLRLNTAQHSGKSEDKTKSLEEATTAVA